MSQNEFPPNRFPPPPRGLQIWVHTDPDHAQSESLIIGGQCSPTPTMTKKKKEKARPSQWTAPPGWAIRASGARGIYWIHDRFSAPRRRQGEIDPRPNREKKRRPPGQLRSDANNYGLEQGILRVQPDPKSPAGPSQILWSATLRQQSQV